VIAVMGDRRDRKTRTSPLINTDDTDQNGIRNDLPRIDADERESGKDRALQDGWPGMPKVPKSPNQKSPKMKSKTLPQMNADGDLGHLAVLHFSAVPCYSF
jgi:hypothetical protein